MTEAATQIASVVDQARALLSDRPKGADGLIGLFGATLLAAMGATLLAGAVVMGPGFDVRVQPAAEATASQP
ncbi:hypothetical protein Q0812_03620 [Brevundimonas sp. 2R-24]|uniref:Peptidoglycan-binding protein n=1 Tax=Peiella sedimenti TaxID=3061083 RepID=A0ABT8SKK2_9CAUL|nr:hypothetical protein [Caulobacteraceae bacterium XZ-24]